MTFQLALTSEPDVPSALQGTPTDPCRPLSLGRLYQTYSADLWDSRTQRSCHSLRSLPASGSGRSPPLIPPVRVPRVVCPIHFSCQFLENAIQKTFHFLIANFILRLYPSHTSRMCLGLLVPLCLQKPFTLCTTRCFLHNHCVIPIPFTRRVKDKD